LWPFWNYNLKSELLDFLHLLRKWAWIVVFMTYYSWKWLELELFASVSIIKFLYVVDCLIIGYVKRLRSFLIETDDMLYMGKKWVACSRSHEILSSCVSNKLTLSTLKYKRKKKVYFVCLCYILLYYRIKYVFFP